MAENQEGPTAITGGVNHEVAAKVAALNEAGEKAVSVSGIDGMENQRKAIRDAVAAATEATENGGGTMLVAQVAKDKLNKVIPAAEEEKPVGR